MFSFIHAADIHLDSPLRGLSRYEGAPAEEIRGATRRALENLVHAALEEEVDFLLIAGDVYDGDWKDHNTGLYFARQMARLKEAGIPVFLIAGNHDAQSVMTKTLQLPENVHSFPTKKAGTVHLEKLGVAIHGQGFASKAVTDDLSAGYPSPVAGAYNIGLLHTSLTGYEGHDTYAPCTAAGLAHLGYDYWALGHIHQMECFQDHDPAIWFSGNIQGRHIRETGPKGCLLVSVDDRGLHHVDFRPLDVLRWAVVSLDGAACNSLADCAEQFAEKLAEFLDDAEERSLALRVELHGATALHDLLVADQVQLQNEIRNAANIHGGDRVWVEQVKVRTRPAAAPPAEEDDGPLAMVAEVVAALRADPDRQGDLAALLEPLHGKLPRELAEAGDLDLRAPETLAELLDEAEPLIRGTWRAVEARP